MLRIVLMVLSAFLMAGCKDISQENSTELITDSTFSKKMFLILTYMNV